MNSSRAKLTSKDIWELIKYGSTAVIACDFVFVLPYLVFLGGGVALEAFVRSESLSRWLGYLLVAVFVLFNCFQLNIPSQ